MSAIRNPHLVVTVRCAAPGCANVRRESNHWFLITIEQDQFTCRPFSPESDLAESDQPACGQACAQKLLEQFLAGGTSHLLPCKSRQLDSSTESCIHPAVSQSKPENKMQSPLVNHLQLEPSMNEQSTALISNQVATVRPSQRELISCVYIGLQCRNCGDVRQALCELPAGETTLCPQCGTACCFSRLGTGLTRRELPFHESAVESQAIRQPSRRDSHN